MNDYHGDFDEMEYDEYDDSECDECGSPLDEEEETFWDGARPLCHDCWETEVGYD